MSNLTNLNFDGSFPMPTPSKIPIPAEVLPVGIALDALKCALDAGVQAAKNHEDAKTQRELILAKKEIEIFAIEATTQKEIENDRHIHQRRIALIQIIGNLIADNAKVITPEIVQCAQVLLQVLRDER